MDGRVLKVMMPFFIEEFGNASSNTHFHGSNAKKAVELATNKIAAVINSESRELIYTSGATEAINLAIKGLYEEQKDSRNHIICLKTEHKAVLDTCKSLENRGAKLDYVDVDQSGSVNFKQLEEKISTDTLLVCVMFANNETGVVQDIKRITDLAHRKGALFFTDATQAFGKIIINVEELGIDMLSISGHKIYGPKGIGVLYIRSGYKISEQVNGGGHQGGRRSGTLNVPAIVGLGEAAEIALNSMEEEIIRLSKMREEFELDLVAAEKIKINGDRALRLPNISNVQLLNYLDADAFILKHKNKISISTGSACNSEIVEASHVLTAMGLSDDDAHKSIRISIGRMTEDMDLIKSVILER